MHPHPNPWPIVPLVALVALFLLAGCVTPDDGNETADPTPTATVSGTPTSSPTPSAAPTATPSPSPTPSATPTPTPAAGETHTVEIGKNIKGPAADYAPNTITVSVGDSIVWKNLDSAAHTATEDDQAWDTGTIAGGQSAAALVFDTEGTFDYYCKIHPSTMNGARVVVEA